MASTSETPLNFVIRTANNKHLDFDVSLPTSSTVLDLKKHLNNAHSTKPVPENQRLIFSGKLLDDTQLLSQVLTKQQTSSNTPIVVHLVLEQDKTSPPTAKIQPKATTSSPSAASSRVQSSATQVSPPAAAAVAHQQTDSNHSDAYMKYLKELENYQHQLQRFMMAPTSTPTATYEAQAYLQYCATHYIMHQNWTTSQLTTSSSHGPSSHGEFITSISNQQPTATTTVPPNLPPPPAPAAPAAAPPVAAVDRPNNGNEREDDLLGTLHMLAELFVLCSIIYFYSTFHRFLVVFVLFIILYLHCRGYFTIQRRRRVVPIPPPVVQVDAQAQADPPVAAADQNQGGGDDEVDRLLEERVETPVQPANEPQNPNDLQRAQPPTTPLVPQVTTTRLLATAFTTFFTSLIPERPQRT